MARPSPFVRGSVLVGLKITRTRTWFRGDNAGAGRTLLRNNSNVAQPLQQLTAAARTNSRRSAQGRAWFWLIPRTGTRLSQSSPHLTEHSLSLSLPLVQIAEKNSLPGERATKTYVHVIQHSRPATSPSDAPQNSATHDSGSRRRLRRSSSPSGISQRGLMTPTTPLPAHRTTRGQTDGPARADTRREFGMVLFVLFEWLRNTCTQNPQMGSLRNRQTEQIPAKPAASSSSSLILFRVAVGWFADETTTISRKPSALFSLYLCVCVRACVSVMKAITLSIYSSF